MFIAFIDFMHGGSASQLHEELAQLFGEASISFLMAVKRWVVFRKDPFTLNDVVFS